jgi:hypothetical protein
VLFITVGALEIAEHIGHHNDIQSVLIRHPEMFTLSYNLHFIFIIGNHISTFAQAGQELLFRIVGSSRGPVSEKLRDPTVLVGCPTRKRSPQGIEDNHLTSGRDLDHNIES